MQEIITTVIIVESALILVYSILSTWYYAAKDRTPMYVIIICVISWFLAEIIVVLIPLDIYTVKTTKNIKIYIGKIRWGCQ